MDVDEGAMPAAPVLTDAPADTAAEPPVAEQRPPAATEAEAATRAPVPVPEGTAGPAAPEAPLPADAEGVQPEQQGEDLEAAADVLLSPLEPRPVELTPGPSLSRGAKLLQRVGTPVAAGKLQQLLAGSACDQGRKQGALFPSPGALQPAGGSGGPGPRHGVRRMSRGERLLAALKHGGGGGGPHSSPAACPPADEAATEDGPTLAPAAAVLLS